MHGNSNIKKHSVKYRSWQVLNSYMFRHVFFILVISGRCYVSGRLHDWASMKTAKGKLVRYSLKSERGY